MRAIRNPDLVVRTLQYAREHGIPETAEVVRGAVSDDTAIGYSCAGTVVDTGGVPDLSPGQRVACAGAGHANHAEVVSVPGNLVAPVPDGVDLRDAAFTTVGSIALQGVRRAQPTLGERAVVVGLGLIGLITVQLLRAAGCAVAGVEPVSARRRLASGLGCELVLEPDGSVEAVREWSRGHGADAVIVTASSSSDRIANEGIEMLRQKGRLVPVGDVGLGIQRAALYRREADVLISTSYGPGRYDPMYEEGGVDYPIGYVRWTENRNMEEFLRLVASRQVDVGALAELEVPVERASEAYAAIAGDSPPLAAVLTYDGSNGQPAPQREVVKILPRRSSPGGDLRVAIVGAGSFVRSTYLPLLKGDARVTVKSVVSRRGTSATDVARSIGGAEAATDWHVAVEDPDVDLVVIGTRHDTHAEIAAAALCAGKSVFVEKPLGLTRGEIDDVWEAGRANERLAIGFNRRLAPLAARLADEVARASGPLHVVYRVSAPLPPENWLNDPIEGGGRLLGEGCHMLDFANWLCGKPVRVLGAALPAPEQLRTIESTSVTVEYEGGSVATVHYSGVGAASMPKERVEVLRGGRSWVLDDFRTLSSYDSGGESTASERRQDKGHAALLERVLAACRGEASFEPGLEAGYNAQVVALAALESIAAGRSVDPGARQLGAAAGA